MTGFKTLIPWNGIFRVALLCTRERIVGRPAQISIDATLWAELPFVFLIEEENRRLSLNRLKPLKSPQSSRRCDEGDGNEKGKNAIGLVSNNSRVSRFFVQFFAEQQHDFDMKMPNFTFYWGREQATTKFCFSS